MKLEVLFRDYNLEAILDSCIISTIDFIVDLVRGMRHVSIMGKRDTLREIVLFLFIVA